jgi:hypothetical protein
VHEHERHAPGADPAIDRGARHRQRRTARSFGQQRERARVTAGQEFDQERGRENEVAGDPRNRQDENDRDSEGEEATYLRRPTSG